MGEKIFQAAMYLRLSKDDNDVGELKDKNGRIKSESNSISNQRALIRSFISEKKDMELYDIYVDDGYSGSNFDRPEFKRMICDIEAGLINCVVVKDLSRFGRDYIESGRYIQKIFPESGVRFIALTDNYDSFHADTGESTIVLPVKNFINDSYCRDISTKVKSQFDVKRKNGDCISPFAVYGYKKAENNRNRLEVDEYAAHIVRKIFALKIEGNTVLSIADKLNEAGILSPKEYKKSIGLNYKGGFCGAKMSLWSSATVKRILTNEMYLGHMVQGKTEKINYKLKKSVNIPKQDWIKVNNTHTPLVSKWNFITVQNLLKTEGRINKTSGDYGFFVGTLFCGDCKEPMIRRVNNCKNTRKGYYICSTKNRGEGCKRHSIPEEQIKNIVIKITKEILNCFMDAGLIYGKIPGIKINVGQIDYYNREITKLEKERDKYKRLRNGLSDDLKEGVITEEESDQLKASFDRKIAEYEERKNKQEKTIDILRKNIEKAACKLKKIQENPRIIEIDRYFFHSLVKRIEVFEGHRVEIEFDFTDKFNQ